MDKKTIFAFLLIGFVLILTQTKFYRDKILKLPPKKLVTESLQADSSFTKSETIKQQPAVKKTAISEKREIISPSYENAEDENPIAHFLRTNADVEYEDVVIETDNYIAHLNPKGAVVSSWVLKNYDFDEENKVQLIKDEGCGNLGIFFINNEDTIYTYDAIFQPDKNYLRFEGNKQVEKVRFVLDVGSNQQLIKTFTFYKDQYIVDLNIEIVELATQFDNNQFFITWNSGLAYTELDYSKHISKEDVTSAEAYVFQGGSKEKLKLSDKPYIKKSRSDFSGVVDWAAIRTKYFAMIILPENDYEIEPVLYGETSPIYKNPEYKDRVKKDFSITLKNIIPPSANKKYITSNFRVYLGPMDYSVIKHYHPTLSKIMDFGMSVIRPFSKGVLASFIFLHKFIPNYGIVLIIFSILIKIAVWPLTRKSYASMHRMQTLQPKISELKEKYSKDPQRMNKETMKLYKEEGVNPVSGCLPQLIQMPLLFAIFIVFRNTIELRDAAFFWWITDLSAPDTIFQLSFSIPFYGNLVNVLPIVMGATMFFQQKMTMKDPKQKAMVYFMPIFFTLLFNSFPSGLNLYYTLFNIFSMAQQKWTPEKKSESETVPVKKLAPAKKPKGKNNKSKRK